MSSEPFSEWEDNVVPGGIKSSQESSEPKEIDGIFDALPQSVKDSIEKRDK